MGAAAKLKSFDVARDKEFYVITITSILEKSLVPAFSTEVANIMTSPMHVIFNCDHLNEICPNWIHAILDLQNQLASFKFQVRLFNLSEPNQNILKQSRVFSAIKVSTTLRAALVDLGLVSHSKFLDVHFVKAFLEGTIHALKTQAFTSASAGKLYRRQTSDPLLGEVSGLIELKTETFCGLIIISFPQETYLKVMSKMLGENFEKIDADLASGASELANIVFGQAKVILNKEGFGIKTALPRMCMGAQKLDELGYKGLRVTVPFESEAGIFYFEIALIE